VIEAGKEERREGEIERRIEGGIEGRRGSVNLT
jgi:hypothetical protein